MKTPQSKHWDLHNKNPVFVQGHLSRKLMYPKAPRNGYVSKALILTKKEYAHP